MKSMTGFGRSSNRLGKNTSKQSNVSLDVSVRSVNGRYLEIRFHVPREYQALESEFKAQLTKVFNRGTLDVYINRTREGAQTAEVKVNTELARKWLKAYATLGKDLKLKSEASLEMITRVPDVLHVEDANTGEVSDVEKKLVISLVKAASEACDEEREREGLSLQNELVSLCKRLENLSTEMESLKTSAKAELENRYRDRLKDGLAKLGFSDRVDDQRIAQEIVIQLDRADISEELMRLKEHLKAYRALLKSPDAQGKKLDFYAQELLREVNTIGSKSHIARLTNLVVEAKTIVEKVREQVQNAE